MSTFFRWNSPRFIKQFIKIGYSKVFKENHTPLIIGFFSLLYLFHWALFQGTNLHIIYSAIIHFGMLMLIASLIVFDKSEIGTIE